MDTVTQYISNYQKKLVYNTYNALKIKKSYKQSLLARMFTIFYCSCGRQAFSGILDYIKHSQN